MRRSQNRARGGFGALILAGLVLGCGGPPPQADPDRAAAALRDALEAWKTGETPAALAAREPAIVVIDHKWQAGYKLIAFTAVDPAGRPHGVEQRFEVELSLVPSPAAKRPGPAPKPVKEIAIYTVGTDPKLTVCRNND